MEQGMNFFEKPVQFGKNYVKFDKNGKVDYVFVVDQGQVKRLVLREKRDEGVFMLPKFSVSKEISDTQNALFSHKKNKSNDKNLVTKIFKMLNGEIKIRSDCFSGMKNVQLCFDGDAPVKFECGVFDKHAKVRLVLPEDMALFVVEKHSVSGLGFCTSSTGLGVNFEHDHFLLVADRRFGDVRTAFSYNGDECFFVRPVENCLNQLDFDLSVCHKTKANAKKEQKKLLDVQKV